MAERVYFLLGSNEGERELFLRSAIQALTERVALDATVLSSSIYETAAWGLEAQPSFLNVAISMQTNLAPQEVLFVIRDIELWLGRQRAVLWGQRTLDIDVLLYGNKVIDTPELSIPHPRLAERRFALVPLAELNGDAVHPVLSQTISALLASCADPLSVDKWRPQEGQKIGN